jgi:hypothetical protein
MSTWKANPDLMARLTAAQNHPANISQDIMTFAGFCDSRTELMAHVVRYELKAAVYVAPGRTRRAA